MSNDKSRNLKIGKGAHVESSNLGDVSGRARVEIKQNQAPIVEDEAITASSFRAVLDDIIAELSALAVEETNLMQTSISPMAKKQHTRAADEANDAVEIAEKMKRLDFVEKTLQELKTDVDDLWVAQMGNSFDPALKSFTKKVLAIFTDKDIIKGLLAMGAAASGTPSTPTT